MPHIQVAGTVIGPSHVRSGRPCEDSFASHRSGYWTSAVVCDGCGSARHAREGAKFISEYLSERLVGIAPEITNRGPGDWIIDAIVNIVAELRGKMRGEFGDSIHEYAATVVGAMVCHSAGFIVHIGDGIASAFAFSDTPSGMVPALAAQSDPQNGEYANETFYVTDPNWIKHIRIEPVRAAQTDCLLLCTDGAQPLLYRRNSPTHSLISLLKQIDSVGIETAPHKIKQFLDSDAARKLSSDDKTLVLLISEDAWARMASLTEPLPGQQIADFRPRDAREPPENVRRQLQETEADGAGRAEIDRNDLPTRRRPNADYRSTNLSTPRPLLRWLVGAFLIGLGAAAAFSYAGTAFLPNLFERKNSGFGAACATASPAVPAGVTSASGIHLSNPRIDNLIDCVASGCSDSVPGIVIWYTIQKPCPLLFKP